MVQKPGGNPVTFPPDALQPEPKPFGDGTTGPVVDGALHLDPMEALLCEQVSQDGLRGPGG